MDWWGRFPHWFKGMKWTGLLNGIAVCQRSYFFYSAHRCLYPPLHTAVVEIYCAGVMGAWTTTRQQETAARRADDGTAEWRAY